MNPKTTKHQPGELVTLDTVWTFVNGVKDLAHLAGTGRVLSIPCGPAIVLQEPQKSNASTFLFYQVLTTGGVLWVAEFYVQSYSTRWNHESPW